MVSEAIDTGIRTICSPAILAANAPLVTPSTASAAVRSVAGQRTHGNAEAADSPLDHPTL